MDQKLRWPIYQVVILWLTGGVLGSLNLSGWMSEVEEGRTYAAEKREKISEGLPRVQTEAFWGEPFGVARVSLTLPAQALVLGPESLVVDSPQNRVFYPAIEEGFWRALVREKTGLAGGSSTIYFLFTGKEPLEVVIRCPNDSWPVRLVPTDHPRRRSRLLADWQAAFVGRPARAEIQEAFCLKEYLESMLVRRLGLDDTDSSGRGKLRKVRERENFLSRKESPEPSGQDWWWPELGVLFSWQSLRAEMVRERIQGRSQHWQQPAEHLLPVLPEPAFGPWQEVAEPKSPPKIEPLASRVPEECLYIRFGSMGNFAWFREFLDWASRQWTMGIAGKGLDYQVVVRSEERLCLRPTGWNRLLGPQLGGQVENLAVADVALISLDLFCPDGTAVGVLFQARSEALLRAELERQRSEAIRRGQGNLLEEKVQIEGREVSLLRSKDGRIRSFYVADGPWHLVSCSRRLVERFLQTRSGQRCLAKAVDFQAIRAKYPPGPEQTAFWYFSAAFWQSLARASYQVEIRRRAQAEVDMLLVEMARQAALAEGRPADTIQTLKAQGFLPPEFGPRTDGSQAVLEDGQVKDSLRGRRGYFIPMADIEVGRLSSVELQQIKDYHQRVFGCRNRLSPMALVFRRSEPKKGMEQIDMELYASPFQSTVLETFGAVFGSPSSERLVPPAGDAAFVEWQAPQARVFLGLRAKEPAQLRFGRGKLLLDLLPPGPKLLLEALRIGYVGRQGQSPLLESIEKLVGGRPDEDGYTGKPGGLWRRQIGSIVLYSFDRQILADVGPLLRVEQTEQPAQIRLQIKDPTGSPLSQWLGPLLSQQAQQATLANLRLLILLENQFHLSGQAALETAQQWLQAQLVCPLGGRYEYRELGRAGCHWVATALAEQPPSSPNALPPPLDWFRGMEGWARWEKREIQIFMSLVRQKKTDPGN
ncbi:MAG: hypothetical protein NZ602_10150 [Thermoguttaceae bacterium]|nr:hypothetical protein [Thermoguttaceae bacterium]MDW8036744.1 hypothetical protein [Thermoguttaceae bacterium]